jgi:diguanylate cyclase (GGDEF)-like protein/PAS domain S-box-containing protein
MLGVVERIVPDHDPGLVALACLVCILATSTSVRLLGPRSHEDRRQRAIRGGAATLAFGIGVWVAHFVAMLAFRPALPISFDVPLCVLSVVLVIAATAIAFALALRERCTKTSIVASGLVLAVGIGAMHFVGERSMRLSGVMHYDPDLVVASLVLGVVCAVAGMWLLARQAVGWASALLALAVVLSHFIAIRAITLDLEGGIAVDPLTIPKMAIPKMELIMAIGGVCFLVLVLALAAAIFDHHFTSRLTEEARRFRMLADATFEGLIFERDGQIVDVNRMMCQLAALGAESLIGRPISDIIPAIELHHQECERPVEHAVRLPDGQTTPVEVLWRSGPDRGERVVAVRDISREKAAEGQIEWMARFDPLTGLANRELFERQLYQALALADRTSTGLSLLYIDLDRFEIISEALGRHAAEQILIQTARRLTGSVRQTDTVARVGRDEFVIIQALIGQPASAAVLADRIMTEMALPFSVDDQPIAVTASIGVALYPGDGAQPQELIKNAMSAVRHAKNDGRARWCYFQSGIDLSVRTKRSLEHDLRIALNENQLSLNYQPFLDTTTQAVIGYEALLRWDHPERGRVPPADFIPLAEECGLIVPIGSWVLSTACAEAVSWDPQLIISVNLSPAQFLQPGIVNTVADALHRTGLSPNRLELEITEGTLMHDAQNALRILTSLKELGVKLAMDDFGTGYSSLSYLRKFPFDKIKIDRSFVSDLEDNGEAQIIVQAVIAMSRSLRLDVTAEGVETEQQLAMLRALGCTFVQGYLLGRPCSADQLLQNAGQPRWQVADHAGPDLATPPAASSG